MIVVIDGQGGGIGRTLVSKLRRSARDAYILAVGTNATATAAMLRAGADAGATGENAVVYNCGRATVVLGPSGIAVENAMHGEISPAMARAVRESAAAKYLLPMERCACAERDAQPARSVDSALQALVEAALAAIKGEN